MSTRPFTRPTLSLWARLAVFFSFLAVLWALAAPVSLLAEDVRTGQLGGLCSAAKSAAGSTGSDAGANTDAALPGAHCDWCGSAPLALPPLPVAAIPSFAGPQVAAADFPSDAAAAVPGLPFSHGPPPLLS